jgi:hypothetical protein
MKNRRRLPWFVSCDEEKCCVHHSSTVQHGSHKNVVPRAIHKGHVPFHFPLLVVFLGKGSACGRKKGGGGGKN